MIDSGGEKIFIHHLFAVENELTEIQAGIARRDRIERQVLLNRRINSDCKRIAGTWIVNIARACCGRRNSKEIRNPFCLPDTFIVEKEESAISNYRAANRCAKLIALESRLGCV